MERMPKRLMWTAEWYQFGEEKNGGFELFDYGR